MKNTDKVKVFSMSILCAAILSGCGGGGDISFTAVPDGGNTGNGSKNPVPPVVQPPEAPEIKVANATEISGIAPAGSKVKVGIYNAQTEALEQETEVTADAFGKWNIPTANVAWENGAAIAAQAVKNNQLSSFSAPRALGKLAPDAQSVKINSLSENQLVGTAPVGTLVRLDVNNDGVIDTSIEPDKFGNWQVQLDKKASSERVTFELQDKSGNLSSRVSKNLPVENKVGGNDDSLPGGGETDPTINIFLTTNTAEIGQQRSPIVTSIQYGSDVHGAVEFDQPGIVSEVCSYGVGKCVSERFEQVLEDAKDEVADAQEKLDAKKKLSGPYDAEEKALKKAKDDLKSLERALPQKNKVVIRDVNDRILKVVAQGTVDLQNLQSSLGGDYLILKDVGIVNIDQIRKDGLLKDYGGTIGREFNRVLLFSDPLGEHLVDAYFRDPAVAGWSYQTFGAFSSQVLNDNRDLNIGYQSIGQKTLVTDLPKNGKATYTGISHAYYNEDQVTSHNAIEVDFSAKSLVYKTTDTPILHTFDKNDLHIIEEKPDYAVNGEASWEKGNRFKGTVKTDSGLQGKIEGQFFGPNVQEIGGVYGLSGQSANGEVHYVGGFGAKR